MDLEIQQHFGSIFAFFSTLSLYFHIFFHGAMHRPPPPSQPLNTILYLGPNDCFEGVCTLILLREGFLLSLTPYLQMSGLCKIIITRCRCVSCIFAIRHLQA